MDRTGVVVVGSYNVGLFLRGAQIPTVGETCIGDHFYESGGGKGSNQAIAASRMGVPTRFIGCIGTDRYGEDALKLYEREGISSAGMRVDSRTHTGISVIFVDGAGRNSIMVVPGSNSLLSREDMEASVPIFKEAKIVGFQLETPLDVVVHGIRLAHEVGAKTLLDPAPACPLPEEIYPMLTYIKPNEVEASAITGIPVTDVESARRAGDWLVGKGVKHAIVTLGEKGAVCVDADGFRHFSTPTLEKPVCDTTGAGDCFSGALMAMLAEGCSLDDAIRIAVHASAVSTTCMGVVESLPHRSEVEALCRVAGEVFP